MGFIRDSVVLVYAFGAAVAITSIVVAIFATLYLDTYPNDARDEGQKQDVYYSVFYLRILAIMTAIFLTCYMAWMYADSRHRVNDKKNRKLFALNKLRLYQMQLTIGEKSAGHRKKLLTGFLVLFILWLPPALIMCFQGWLYKWKKPDKAATLLHICSANSNRSSTCARLYETGVTALVESLFIFFAALIMFISGRSSDVEADVERQKLLDARDDFRKKWEAANGQVGGLQSDIAAAKLAAEQASNREKQLGGVLQKQTDLAQQRANAIKQHEANLAAATKALGEERDRRAAEEARARLFGGGRGRYSGGARGRYGGPGGGASEDSSGASSSSDSGDDRRRYYNRPRPAPRRPEARHQARTPSPRRPESRRRREYEAPRPRQRSPSPYFTGPPRRYRSPSPSYPPIIRTARDTYDFVGYSDRGYAVYRGRRYDHNVESNATDLIFYAGRVFA